jgi:hypothetical protein
VKALSNITSSNYFWYWVIGALAVGVVLGRGPLSGHEPHYLFIYPDKENLKRWVECGDFGNVEAARASARAWMSYFPDGDYEIGIGKPKDWLGIKVYRETVR